MQTQVANSERCLIAQHRVSQLLANLDPDNDAHSRIHAFVSKIVDYSIEMLERHAATYDLVDIDDESDGHEFLALSYHSDSMPGDIASIVALFDNNHFLDVTILISSTRAYDRHTTKFKDTNGDGKLDAVIDATPNSWTKFKPLTIVFLGGEDTLKNAANETQ